MRTLGAKGVELITCKETLAIPVVEAETILDPTGCGDAFRAGFLHQYIRGKNFKECLELGATMGSFAIEQAGGQNHKIEINTIFERMKESFKKNSYKM